MHRLVHGLNAGLALLLIGGSLWAFPRLPVRIPRHFGLGGTADAYWAATLVHWMLVPAIALIVVGLVYGTATAMLVVFGVAQWGTYQVATSATDTFPGVVRGVTLGVPMLLLGAAGGLAWWLPPRVWRLADDA